MDEGQTNRQVHLLDRVEARMIGCTKASEGRHLPLLADEEGTEARHVVELRLSNLPPINNGQLRVTRALPGVHRRHRLIVAIQDKLRRLKQGLSSQQRINKTNTDRPKVQHAKQGQ